LDRKVGEDLLQCQSLAGGAAALAVLA
jgi:hypothetical protein